VEQSIKSDLEINSPKEFPESDFQQAIKDSSIEFYQLVGTKSKLEDESDYHDSEL